MAAGNPRGRVGVNRVLRPRRPYPSHPWGLRPQPPRIALNALVLKRRTG
ncbi:hypothetical protein OHA74_34170 [Streptomyces phaeochromogenes]|nr:hypothetical protein [Streptomyces phaeochromogenes]